MKSVILEDDICAPRQALAVRPYGAAVSLAELDPALGGNTDNLLAYADTAGGFPSNSVAR